MTDKPSPKYDEAFHGRLERYLAGECGLAERAQVESWLQAEPANRAYLESLRAAGEAWAEARPRFDSRAAWQRMVERATPASPEPSVAEPRPALRETAWQASSRRPTIRRWVAAGAIAAAAIVGIVLAAPRLRPARQVASVAREYVTQAGEQQAITLPDGTKVRLAPQSRLSVEEGYGAIARTVRLVGQGYFEVTHDAARPFRVLAGSIVAWDLGTKFTVRAYAGEPLRLAVAEGSVAVPQALSAPLRPLDIATIDSAGHGTVRHGADLGRYTGWLDGTLEFRETPLSEAAADLARWYGVDIVIGNPVLARRRITVSIKEATVEGALDLIAPAVGARYSRQGSVVRVGTPEAP